MSYTELVAGGVGGNKTASITCTTPLSAIISATVTMALSIYTLPFVSINTVKSVPSNVVAIIPLNNVVDITVSAKTWCFKISVRVGMSFNKAVTVPAGKALNAASVGANKVNVPGADNVPSNPQASIAVSKVVWSLELATMSYTELLGTTSIVPTIPAWAWAPAPIEQS